MPKLPEEFADLERFTDWCLPNEADRYQKRLSSTMSQPRVILPAGGAIASDLTGNDAGVAVELVGNLSLREPLIEPPHEGDQRAVGHPRG